MSEVEIPSHLVIRSHRDSVVLSKHSKDHHYVPQGILRNFCFSGSTVFFADRENAHKGIQPRNVGSIFFQKHVNSYMTTSGERDDSPEREIAREIDDSISVVIRDLASKPIRLVSDSEKKTIARYILSVVRRSPNARREFLDEINLDKQIAKAEELSGISWRTLQENWFEESVPQSLAEYLSSKLAAAEVVEHVELLLNSNLAVAVPSGGGLFIIGDVPMFGRSDQLLGEAMDDFEIWTVVAPTLMVGFLRSPHVERSLQVNLEITDPVVDLVNLEIAARSRRIASKDRKLIQEVILSSKFFSPS